MRIIIADGKPEIRSGLKGLFEQEKGLNVVGEAAEMSGLLFAVQEAKPDLLLVDWELPKLPVAALISLLRMLCPGLRIIAMSGRPESQTAAIHAGVDAFVSKGDQPDELLQMINNQNKSK